MDQAYQKLGELLLTEQLISAQQLEEALVLQSKSRLRLGEVLVRHGFVSEDVIASALGKQYGYEVVDPGTVYPSPDALALLSFSEAASQCLLPVSIDRETIQCLVSDPLNVPITDELAFRHRRRVILSVAPDTKLKARILEAYRGELRSTAAISSVQLPERFGQPIPRFESQGILWIDAHDSFLDRPVSMAMIPLECPFKERHYENIKATAKHPESGLATVHDSVIFENCRVTTFERLEGVQLSESLRTGKPNSPAESARVVSQMARLATELNIRNPSWICAENIWINHDLITVAPIFVLQPDNQSEFEVEALGRLLGQCLLGRLDSRFDPTLLDTQRVPAGMVLILQRCLMSEKEKFKSPWEVFQALSNFKWANETKTALPAHELDRDELLATLRVVGSSKPTLWQKLFGRRAA